MPAGRVGAEPFRSQVDDWDGPSRHVLAPAAHGGIIAPTLVIAGEQDLLTPPWVARNVAGGIPGARFEIVTGDGSSHLMPVERPDDFTRLVANFLAE